VTRRMLHAVAGVALAAGVFPLTAQAQGAKETKPESVPYTWKSVQIVGGGFVGGIVFHPTAKGVRYARTDMGGAYRWNDKTKRWDPILDWIPYKDLNLMGVESIAVDPSDPNRVYLACGTYTNPRTPDGAILRSADRGETFQRTDVPFKFGGNENGRGNGERMAVDPNDGRVLFLGTRHAGLWTSRDGAVTWSRVESFPNLEEEHSPNERPWESRNNGVVFTLFDPRSGRKGQASQTIYAGVALKGPDSLFRSTDGGKSWRAVPGQPAQYRPTHGILASDGVLYLSYGNNPGPGRMSDGAVWKLDTRTGEWTDITPVKPDPEHEKRFGYAAVAVDAHNPRVVIASSFGRMNGAGGEDDIFRSTDGGATWKPVFGSSGTFDYSLAPYVARTPIHWLFDIEIDPVNPDHAMFTTGYGGWETFDLRAMDSGRPTHWSIMNTGIEETVALELLSPPKGAHLITAVGDYGSFVHWDLDMPAPEGASNPPLFGNTDGVACAENKPEVVVRVGRSSHHHPGFNISYSLDAGKNWQPPAAMPTPNSASGHIAVSSDGETWVWTPRGELPQLTRDRGATWTECRGVPRNTRVIADRVDPRKFYAMALFDGKLFVSTDAAASFADQALTLADALPLRGGNRGDNRGGQDRLYAAPGSDGELWLAAFNGLYRSQDTGKSFVHLAGVEEIHGFGFGKSAPHASCPALYLVGVVSGERGIFRSDDTGQSWVRINDDQHQWGLVLHVTGDPKQYGRVYVGTHGRGTFYGDPVAAKR